MSENVVKVVVSVGSFIPSHGLNHHQFQFLSEISAEFWDVFYHAEVRWLSRGSMLKRFVALRLQIEVFMNENKFVAKCSDEKWLWDLTLMCGIIHHISDLNIELQGQQKLTSDVWGCQNF
jgi:hypothetical protein